MVISACAQDARIKIADIVVAMRNDDDRWRIKLDARLGPCASDAVSDIMLDTHYGILPDVDLNNKTFDSGSAWSSFEDAGKVIFALRSSVHGPDPTALAVIDTDFSSGDIYISAKKLRFPSEKNIPMVCPLIHPLDQLTVVRLLSRREGVMLHSCGINYNGRGILFMGVCSAGKSTTAKLWQKEGCAILLNDDRNVIKRVASRFYLYGTPWPGDVTSFSPERVPLEKIFFLKQARENSAFRLSPADTASRLLVMSFPTLWDKEGMGSILKTISEIAIHVPSYELSFLPDESSVDFVKNHRDI